MAGLAESLSGAVTSGATDVIRMSNDEGKTLEIFLQCIPEVHVKLDIYKCSFKIISKFSDNVSTSLFEIENILFRKLFELTLPFVSL